MSAVSLDQLAGISRDQSDPNYYRANQIMAVSFLNKMSESCSKRSLEHIAANPLTPLHMLKELATHDLEDVRVAVAENVSTPLDTLLLAGARQTAGRALLSRRKHKFAHANSGNIVRRRKPICRSQSNAQQRHQKDAQKKQPIYRYPDQAQSNRLLRGQKRHQ